jgi:hypothetical protein
MAGYVHVSLHASSLLSSLLDLSQIIFLYRPDSILYTHRDFIQGELVSNTRQQKACSHVHMCINKEKRTKNTYDLCCLMLETDDLEAHLSVLLDHLQSTEQSA